MAVIRESKRKYFDGLASEFNALKKIQPGLTYESFINTRGVQCSVATFCRRLNAYLERMALGITAVASAPWDILTPFLLGAYLGFLDIWHDHTRKGHTCSLSAAIAKFRQWASEHGYNLDAISDDRLREIAKYRAMARMILPPEGMPSYRAVAGMLLFSACHRLERVQIDATELPGLFISRTGEPGLKAWVIAVICISTKVIVGWQYYLRPPRASDAVRLIHQIHTCNGEHVAGTSGGPIGTVQSDNGIFHSEIFRDYLDRVGVTLEHIQPGHPVQDGAIEKGVGDIKRGLIFSLTDETFARMESVRFAGQLYFTEEGLEKAVADSVNALNLGLRRETNPLVNWQRTPPLEQTAHGWGAKILANGFMDHWDLKIDGARVELDGGVLARASWVCGESAKQCYVREYIPEGRLELRAVTLDGRHISLGKLDLVGHRIPKIKPASPVAEVKQSTATRPRRPGENWEESYG